MYKGKVVLMMEKLGFKATSTKKYAGRELS
jgi:hypothetical protein